MTLTTFSTSQEAQQAAALMEGYHFELGRHDAPQWISLWLASYSPAWVKNAVIEALYQGRYKAVSVRQILELWEKRQKPIRHASHDFEAAVCREYKHVKPTPEASKPSTKPVANFSASHQEPATLRASRRTHQSLSSISFNLSEMPPLAEADTGNHSQTTTVNKPAGAPSNIQLDTPTDSQLDPQPATRTSRQELIETAETLQSQRQLNGVLYSSARAIQPFKPALPFSAQTLRLAKQKALATR